MAVFTHKVTLDRFEPYSSELTKAHQNQIETLAISIKNSFFYCFALILFSKTRNTRVSHAAEDKMSI